MSKQLVLLTSLAALMSGSAAADTHLVRFMGNGFFPAITYAEPGDRIIIRNETPWNARVDAEGTIAWDTAATMIDDDCFDDDDDDDDDENRAGTFDDDDDDGCAAPTQNLRSNLNSTEEASLIVTADDDVILTGDRYQGGWRAATNPGRIELQENPPLNP